MAYSPETLWEVQMMRLKSVRTMTHAKVSWLEDDLMPRLRWSHADPRDDFGFPSTWEDCPRKPKVNMTAHFGYKLAYGTVVRMVGATNDSLLRYLGGDWWERLA